jgi:hypothetical protein
MHFMNPVPVMPLVEIIRGMATSDATFQRVEELAKRMGKTPIEVSDYPGFVSNRVLLPMINEAIFALYEGVATAESIDGVMKLGMNHPMGPIGRFHRAGRLPGDSPRSGRRIWRSEIPPVPLARQNGGRGMAWPKKRARVLPVQMSPRK